MTHAAFALYAVYSRRRLKMSIGEALQLILGFAAPILLVSHVLGTRAAMQLYGTEDTYAYVLLALWVDNPMGGLQQAAATIILWVHACIGLYYWLRLKPWFMRILPWLYGVALLVPVLGLLGFVFAGRAVERLAAEDPGFRLDLAIDNNGAGSCRRLPISTSSKAGYSWVWAAAIALTLLARALRLYLESREGVVRITYPEGRIVSVPPGMTILEASQLNDIPHAAVCGGRGRCSTCRVRVNGPHRQPPGPG